MLANGLDNLITNGQHGIERGHRFLKNHGNMFSPNLLHLAAILGQQILSVKQNLPPYNPALCLSKKLHNGHGSHTLATAGLADDAKNLATFKEKADIVHCSPLVLFLKETGGKIFDL